MSKRETIGITALTIGVVSAAILSVIFFWYPLAKIIAAGG